MAAAESGFIRIHWDKGNEPQWFNAARVERGEPPAAGALPPVQAEAKRPVRAPAAAPAAQPSCEKCKCTKKCGDELETARPFDFAAVKRRAGVVLTLAAFVLFIIACSSQEWVIQQQRYLTLESAGKTTTIVANVRRGPWAYCLDVQDSSSSEILADARNLGPRCVSIDNDCEAEFDFFVGTGSAAFTLDAVADDNRASCHSVRGVRATLIIAIIFAFYAAMVQWKNQVAAGTGLGFVAAVFGMSGMAIARDQYSGLAFADYGFGFWVSVIAWTLCLFAAFVFWYLQDEKRRVSHLVTFLAAVVFTFLVVSVTTHSVIYHYETSTTTSLSTNVNMTRGEWYQSLEHTTFTTGLWKYCTKVEEADGLVTDVCYDIDNSCELDNKGRALHGQKLAQCDKFRTMRAFLIIGVVLAGIVFLLLIANFSQGKWYWINFTLLALVELSIFITIAVTTDFYYSPVNHYGHSFWVMIVGFACTFVLHVVFAASNKDVAGNYRNWLAMCIALSSFVAICTAISMSSWVVLQDKPLFNDMHSNGNYPARYGLWRICRGPNQDESCVDISSDSQCTVNDGDDPNFGDCHRFNAVRAFALLTALSAFFYFTKSAAATCQEDGKADSPKRIRMPGMITAVMGATATALAVSYYDLEAKEYGFSFWIFLLSWLSILIVTVIQCLGHKKNALADVALKLTFVAFLFFIIAASKPAIIRSDVANPGAPTTDRLALSTGWFHQCYKTGVDVEDPTYKRDPLQRCRFINTECKTAVHGMAMDDCAKFNGIRATGVIALLLAGLAVIAQASFARGNDAPGCKGIAFFFPFFSAFFGMVSMALTLSYYEDQPASVFGYPFWLAVIAWVLVSVSGVLFNIAHCEKKKEASAESGVEMASRA